MHTYSETRILPFMPQQLFDLVVDIERYPEFLPWCRAARIMERKPEHFLGELIITFSHITERYTSQVTPFYPSPHRVEDGRGADLVRGLAGEANASESPPPNLPPMGGGNGNEHRIEVDLVHGPFTHLRNHWRFVPHENGCELHFAVDFAFKSKLLNRLIGGMFTRASERMVAAFTARAETLYGKPTA